MSMDQVQCNYLEETEAQDSTLIKNGGDWSSCLDFQLLVQCLLTLLFLLVPGLPGPQNLNAFSLFVLSHSSRKRAAEN